MPLTPAGSLLDQRVAADAASPLLTYYDDAAGERVELSGATAHNWVSKAANLFAEELRLEPGDEVTVAGDAHWHTAVLVLAAWRAELVVRVGGPPDTTTTTTTTAAAAAATPLEWTRLATDLPVQPDQCLLGPPDPQAAALAGDGEALTQAELTGRARDLGLPDRARLLTVAERWDAAGLVAAVLGPLACAGSLVISRHTPEPTLAARAGSERVTRRI